MNSAFQDILAAKDADRRDLFLTTASRIGTTLQNIEKDYWVCWIYGPCFRSWADKDRAFSLRVEPRSPKRMV